MTPDSCVVRVMEGSAVSTQEMEDAFKEYPGDARVESILHNLVALPEGPADHLAAFLYYRFPESAPATYLHAVRVYDRLGAGEAAPLLENRLELVKKHDYLARQYVMVLTSLQRNAAARQFVMEFFETYNGDLWRQPGFAKGQADAISRGCPPILIVTLPKSGSVFLLNTLSTGLKAPHTALSALGINADLIPSRVRELAKGGAIAVEHCWPTERDLGLLAGAGIRKIVFHYRDIRQSTLSFVHHSASDEVTMGRQALEEWRVRLAGSRDLFERRYINSMTRWIRFLEQWLEVLETDTRFEFMVTGFDDLADEEALFTRLLRFFEVPEGLFDWSTITTSKKDRAGHFRKGLKDEWRGVLSPETQTRVGQLIADYPRVSASLSLQAGELVR